MIMITEKQRLTRILRLEKRVDYMAEALNI